MRNLKLLACARRACWLGFVVTFSSAAFGQSTFTNLGGEYAIVGTLSGDQTASHASVNNNGGWLVWQDNAADADGFGIRARRLDSGFSGDLSIFTVNEITEGFQENPQVALLQNGGAVFVWQGGPQGLPDIYARFMSAAGSFITGDVLVNTYTNQYQKDPAVACLNNGNVVVAWSSYGQDGSLAGIYAQILSPTGAKLGSEFLVNQSTDLRQLTPVVAALANGNFVITWSSEKARVSGGFDVNITGRIFSPSGAIVGNEFLISSGTNSCSHPTVASDGSGGFAVGWNQQDMVNAGYGLDIYVRSYDSAVLPHAAATRVNSHTLGDQFVPAITATGTNYFAVWTSLGQDGSYEGVYGQFLALDGTSIGPEIRINSTTIGKQMQPSVVPDGAGNFLVVWSSYVGGGARFDLYAQRFTTSSSPGLVAPSIPYVSALSQGALSVSWPELAGYPVAFYELTVDGSPTPLVVNGLQTVVSGLTAGSTHTFRLRAHLTGGQDTPFSGLASGTTWGADDNSDGLPDDWQAAQWGADPANWPSPDVDSDGDGASNLAEFLAGTNPNDSGSVLRTQLKKSGADLIFSWNTQPGFVYQAQFAFDMASWQNLGSPRFAHGVVDFVVLTGGMQPKFYRVTRLR